MYLVHCDVRSCTDRRNMERIMMRSRNINLVMAFLALTLFIEGAIVSGDSDTLQDHWGAAIYGDIVVWMATTNSREDIYGYNLATKHMFQVTTHAGPQEFPAVYDDIVVWMDYRNRNWDIYGYNLTTGQEFEVAKADGDQMDTAIYDGIVLWADNRNGNWDIYGYNLSTGEELYLSSAESNQMSPAIYDNVVVWSDDRNGSWDIYACDVLTGKEIPIAVAPGDQKVPEIFEDFVIWRDNRNGNWDIYGYNLTTAQEVPIVINPSSQALGGIYGNIVVWVDDRNGDFDVYGYDLAAEEEFAIAVVPNNQLMPAIHGDTVVWTEGRNDRLDLYGHSLSSRLGFWITGEDQQPHEGETEDYEAEYLVLETYHLEGAILTVCFQNKLDTESIMSSEYKNDSLITSQLQEILQGNAQTCFSLHGEYAIGDNVTLLTEKGTILSFTVNPEEVETPSEMDVYTKLVFLIPLLLAAILVLFVILRKKGGYV